MSEGRGRARPCSMGSHVTCVDPRCPRCFPRLGSSEGNGSAAARPPSWTDEEYPPLPGGSEWSREESSDLVELVVVLCSRDGTEKRALRAIRCRENDALSEIRTAISAMDVTNIPAKFSFLRSVEGHVVPVDDDQEAGPKAYKAKHFAPPYAPAARLCIFDRDRAGTTTERPSQAVRQRTEDVMEFCVRRMAEEDRSESVVLGMVRMHVRATLAEVRREIRTQLAGKAPIEFRFVRIVQGTVTLLTRAQEGRSSSGRGSLCAYHFAPPYTSDPEFILLTRKSYTEGEVVADETKTRELKSLEEPLRRPQGGHPHGMDPRDVVKSKARAYINSFLNSSGGVLIFGASDDGVVERVPISGRADAACSTLQERVKLARAAKDDVRKLVDGFCQNMDPPVDEDLVTTQFVPVWPCGTARGDGTAPLDESIAAEHGIYNVIEIHVKPGRRSLYFTDKHSYEAHERRDGSTHVMEADAVADVLSRGRRGDRWRGGWRQLRSAFDFDGLMRRLSDPWAGREWLFDVIREKLLECNESERPIQGIYLTGSRGMGKSAFLSELTLRPIDVTQLEVLAHHLCRSDDPDTLSPGLFVHSIAALLARKCKQFRSLMVEPASSPGSDPMGASMLRALRPEQCEIDPDDALLRGVLQPLWEIDRRVREKRCRRPGRNKKLRTPLLIVVDAIDESVAGRVSENDRRSRSATIAGLLERALSDLGGLPPWIKLVVSFRREMLDMPGPIQRLANNLTVCNLDPDEDDSIRRSQEDIHLFVEAYMERIGMVFPSTKACAKIGEKVGDQRRWEFEAGGPDNWVLFDESLNSSLLQEYDAGKDSYSYNVGTREFLVDFKNLTRQNTSTRKVHKMRLIEEPAPPSTRLLPENAACLNKEAGSIASETKLFDILLQRSRGNYLYARTVLDDINSGSMSWEEVSLLPEGLDHLYSTFFQRHFERNPPHSGSFGASKFYSTAQPVLEIILAAPKRGLLEQEIAHAVFAGTMCDPAAVPFCLRDIRWALDIDSSLGLPKYRLIHESIRSWLEECGNTLPFSCEVSRGHKMLAASLLQRSWPQQHALTKWLTSPSSGDDNTMNQAAEGGKGSAWFEWAKQKPNSEDIFLLVHHLAQSDINDTARIELLKAVGTEVIDSVHGGGRKATALHTAALAGNVHAVRLLLGAGADVDICVSGRCPIHLAAGKGYSQTVLSLLSSGADVSRKTASGRTALLCAAGSGSVQTVKYILEAILYRGERSDTDAEETVRELLDASQIDSGRTALSVAAEEGHSEIVLHLLRAGATATLADRLGRTSLYYAALSGRLSFDAVKALASAPGGQDTLAWGECKHLRSPLHAAFMKPVISDEESNRLEILKLLLDTGRCNLNQREAHGCTPLWYAAKGGWTKAVALLLDAGAYINPEELPNVPGESEGRAASPLHVAIECGNYETAALLLSRGAHVPSTYDVDNCTVTSSLPVDLVKAMKGVKENKKDDTKAVALNNLDSYEVSGLTKATKCKPVPRASFARWPPARQAAHHVNGE